MLGISLGAWNFQVQITDFDPGVVTMITGPHFKIRGAPSLQLWFQCKCFSLSPFSEQILGCPFSPKSPGALYSKLFLFFFFGRALRMGDLSSPTRDQTRAPCIGSMES